MSRSISWKILLAGVLLIATMVPRRAMASCVAPHRIDTGAIAGQQGGPYLVSNPDWRGAGGDQSCAFGYGCYDTEAGPPISADLFGVFWALGTGDPVVGVGDDNGAWTITGWSKQASADQNGGEPLPGGLYHYPAWLTRPTTPPVFSPNSVAGDAFDWADALVDGCVANAGATSEIDGTECTCVLLSDQWNGEGYFSLLSARVNELENFDLPVVDAIRFGTISQPRIMGTIGTPNSDVEVDVLADPVTGGIFESGGCECGLGYKVYAHLVPRSDMAPVDREEGWYEPPRASGEPQTITPLGQETTVTIDCDETTQQGFFLSIRLVTDDGFATRFGSVNSFRVECPLGCSNQDRDGDAFTECDGDCDDLDATVFPGAPQSCDGLNNDCDEEQWPSLTGTNEFDDDADMLSECEGDCDDGDPGRNGALGELSCDGIDNDCEPLSVDAPDADLDGFDVCGADDLSDPDGAPVDCDDSLADVYPGATQVCDGLNNDCLDAAWPLVPADEADADGDLHSMCAGDCNDSEVAINPDAFERCNAIDDDCDALVDEDDLGEDTDGDGVHNLCDNCREDVNPNQADVDGDGAGNSCDNCRNDRNPTQSDVDGDDEGDICDLDDGTIYILFNQPEYVEWQEEVGYSQWNCYRGDLALLRINGIYTQDPMAVDLADRYCAQDVPWVLDPDPVPSTAVFYLTTGLHPESDLGTRSGGEARPNSNPCP